MPITFPVVVTAGPLSIHAHFIFESLAYAVGFRLYQRRRRLGGDFLTTSQRFTMILAALAGAALGSKILYWFEDPALTLTHIYNLSYLIAGKTIVGGLLGGTIAVEWAKRRTGITRRTGDLYVFPMIAAIAIGRVGCFLEGLPDHTYGLPTMLPWGINFGDGIHRHPTQLYEVVFLLALGFMIARFDRTSHREGDLYRVFLISYLGFRFIIDFLKPGVSFVGLTGIQWACLAGILAYWRDIPALILPGRIQQSWVTASVPISSTTRPSRSVPSATAAATPKSSSKTEASIS